MYKRQILNGELDDVSSDVEPAFGLDVPRAVPGVPRALLDVRKGWRDPARYDEKARELARRFDENFATYRDHVSGAVARSGPRVG